MNKYGSAHFNWKDNQLYQDNKKTGISVVLFEEACFHPGTELYKIKFKEGDLSMDYYNISRAKDNAMKYAMREYNKTQLGNAYSSLTGESLEE